MPHSDDIVCCDCCGFEQAPGDICEFCGFELTDDDAVD